MPAIAVKAVYLCIGIVIDALRIFIVRNVNGVGEMPIKLW